MNAYPYVGQPVDYYPNNKTRHAAIITEVHPNGGNLDERPIVDLCVFAPGEPTPLTIQEVSPIEPQPDDTSPEDITLAERWAFQHEGVLHSDTLAEGNDDSALGTQTNMHVGTVVPAGGC